MPFIETTKNEYGTPVDAYVCDICRAPFTICPAHKDRSIDDQWTGCMGTDCASYDPARDVDRLFDDGNVKSFEQRANPRIIRRVPIPPAAGGEGK